MKLYMSRLSLEMDGQEFLLFFIHFLPPHTLLLGGWGEEEFEAGGVLFDLFSHGPYSGLALIRLSQKIYSAWLSPVVGF